MAIWKAVRASTHSFYRHIGEQMGKTIYDAVIIGAGASGLMAAIAAARAGADVILLEHMDQAAKKILATGNGKCNYTNADQEIENYYCDDPDFVRIVLEKFSFQDTVRFFDELGIRPVQKNGTCIYPQSGQASSVKDILLAEVRRLHIPLLLSVGIRSVHKNHQKLFEIETKERRFYGRACILAAGGCAAKKTGSDGSGYVYAKQLGHTIVPPVPALAALLTDEDHGRLPAGIRIACTAALFVDDKKQAVERGELQITDYGISGIVIFQFSRIASKALAQHRQVRVSLDFQPELSKEQLAEYLAARFCSIYHKEQTMADALLGFFPDKLIPVLLMRAGLAADRKSARCSRKQAARLADQSKRYEVLISGIKGFDFAQVTAGGVPVHEINPHRMESKKTAGLYFAGELVDVDAKCGGYNLQWAWASGYTAGISVKEINHTKGELR